MVCNIIILWLIVLVSDGWCRILAASARLVSNVFLYNTFCYWLSNKIDIVQFFKNIFPFKLRNFQNYHEKCVFAVFSQNVAGNYVFFEYEECHYNDHFKRFHHFRLRYHSSIFLSTYVDITANSEEISAESELFS